MEPDREFNLIIELRNALNGMIVAVDHSTPELFVGHHEDYLRTVVEPRAKEVLQRVDAIIALEKMNKNNKLPTG